MKSVKAQLEAIAKRRNGDIEKVAQESLNVLASNIIARSPVRDGFFRNAWLASYGSADTTQPKTADPSGKASTGRLEKTLNGLAIGNQFYFVNNLPYAERLENGWSEQAPLGMVKTAIPEWPSIVERAVKRYR